MHKRKRWIMDLNELWIGDKVKIIKSGKVGTFEGVGKTGKARVNYQNKILLVAADNLSILKEKEDDIQLQIDERKIDSLKDDFQVKKKKFSGGNFSNQIDLHIEKLNPNLEHAHPQVILDHQLEMCKLFLEYSIEKKKDVVTIIHGRGKGALRQEVLHMLKNYRAVRFAVEVNNGGAQEVWLNNAL